jgi:hypothetical protein
MSMGDIGDIRLLASKSDKVLRLQILVFHEYVFCVW